jgi:hypothetical protein
VAPHQPVEIARAERARARDGVDEGGQRLAVGVGIEVGAASAGLQAFSSGRVM